jgi:predicted ATPase
LLLAQFSTEGLPLFVNFFFGCDILVYGFGIVIGGIMPVPVIALTGGPKAGKSTVLTAIKSEFLGEVLVIEEVATTLARKVLFPMAGRDLPASVEWTGLYQQQVYLLQKGLEQVYQLKAAHDKAKLIVIDRGTLDGAAYFDGGLAEFVKMMDTTLDAELARYLMVIHFESLATANPSKFDAANNEFRMETLEQAQELERRIVEIWTSHPWRPFIVGSQGILGKIGEVLGMLRLILAKTQLYEK